MLDNLGHVLPRDESATLLNRLDNRDTTTALAAEAELSLLWALDQVSHVVVEPAIPQTKARIDAFTLDLLASGPAAVEVRAISDRSFSGEEDMERAANIITQFANTVRRGSGEKLHFTFGVGYSADKSGLRRRVRLVTKDYKLTAEHKDKLREWIEDDIRPDVVGLADEKIGVTIRWEERGVHPAGRTFCSMPPVAEDIEENPLFRALKAKEAQFSKIPKWITRVVFIADAGCHVLWSAHTMGVSSKSAEEIVWHFLSKSKISVVCLFSPRRPPNILAHNEPMRWHVRIFDKREGIGADEHKNLRALAGALPVPSLEGYQARQRYQQGELQATSAGRYRGTEIVTKGGKTMTIRVSSRAVQELIAGRIDRARFEHIVFGERPNLMALQLAKGQTIQSVAIEPSGLDKDDDLIVFELAPDSAAAPLRAPRAAPLRKRLLSWVLKRLVRLALISGVPIKGRDERPARVTRS